MPPALSITTLRDDADLQQVCAQCSQVFQFPVDRAPAYYESAGKENIRLARVGDALAGSLAMLPMGQFWGGVSVPMAGFAVVAVAPEFRSPGVGARMMQAAIHELHDRNIPLATLYPATQPIYRKAGFEVAGHSFTTYAQTAAIDAREPAVDVALATPADEPAIRAMYRAWAAREPGNLDRNEFIWKRVSDYRRTIRRGYLLKHGTQLEGYFYCGNTADANPRMLNVGDCVMTTTAAAQRFLQFLADHRSMDSGVTWVSPPADPLLLLLREQSRKVEANTSWMLRIVRVAEALSLRGYPRGLSAELHLELRDETIPENTRTYLLTVENGHGKVTRVERGAGLSMDIRTLAPLYSGYASAEQLASLGLIAGDAEAQATATAIFAGPAPWMRDLF